MRVIDAGTCSRRSTRFLRPPRRIAPHVDVPFWRVLAVLIYESERPLPADSVEKLENLAGSNSCGKASGSKVPASFCVSLNRESHVKRSQECGDPPRGKFSEASYERKFVTSPRSRVFQQHRPQGDVRVRVRPVRDIAKILAIDLRPFVYSGMDTFMSLASPGQRGLDRMTWPPRVPR